MNHEAVADNPCSDAADRDPGAASPSPPPPPPPRVLAELRGGAPGPCVICMTSMHGNEPSGLRAFERVLQAINADRRRSMRGDLIGLVGNRAALAKKRRFISHDLNRVWTNAHIDRVRAMDNAELAASAIEDREQRGIIETLERVLSTARGETYFIDLHTTSAKSRPFVLIGDTLRNRRFARAFPVPIILGLEEQLDGAITEWINSRGHITIGFESGQHDDPIAIDRHEAGIWLALAAAGVLDANEIPHFDAARAALREAAEGLPAFIEVRARHGITPDSQFLMRPGYENLAPIRRGERLATDRGGDIRAHEDGRILLPLYQGEGADGFFLARDVKPLWLRVSAILRRLGADRLAPLLPGVHRHPTLPDTLLIDPGVARWFADEVFHLLGYRKRRMDGSRLVVSRRRFDF